MRRNWTRPALADWEGRALSYGQVADEIARLHEVFRICHVRPGDKVALLGRNSASWAVVWLATVTYGAVIVPILPDFRPDDVHHIVNHSDAVLLFVADALFAPLDAEKLRDVAAVFSLTDFRILHCRKETLARSLADVLVPARDARLEQGSPGRFQTRGRRGRAARGNRLHVGDDRFLQGGDASAPEPARERRLREGEHAPRAGGHDRLLPSRSRTRSAAPSSSCSRSRPAARSRSSRRRPLPRSFSRRSAGSARG